MVEFCSARHLQGTCKAVCKAVLVVKSCANISSCFLAISLCSHWLPLAQPPLTARHLQGNLHGTCAWQNLEAVLWGESPFRYRVLKLARGSLFSHHCHPCLVLVLIFFFLIFGSLFLLTAGGALVYARRDAAGTTAEHKRASRAHARHCSLQ